MLFYMAPSNLPCCDAEIFLMYSGPRRMQLDPFQGVACKDCNCSYTIEADPKDFKMASLSRNPHPNLKYPWQCWCTLDYKKESEWKIKTS